ncbi:exopolysaccharide biosynthesis polyprenyl glycosylphosphotransferase [Candidatus Gracilibacteria bacterium]|nr:MAG: exopolysaccharide biosynthesis polyprenyl glycosylphosphotransferase [Candidatus Gracilibacteria bacterium]
MRKSSSKAGEFALIFGYSIYWFIFFSFFVYAGNGIVYETEIPRLISGVAFLIGTFLVILERIFLNNLEFFLIGKGILSKKKIILVNNKKYSEIKKIVKNISNSGDYEIVGYVNDGEVKGIEKNIKYIGNLDDLQVIFEKGEIDEILYIDSDFGKKDLKNLWELTRIFGVSYKYITNSFDVTKTNTTLSLINNLPVIEIKNTPLNSWSKIFKRIFDFFAGLFGVIIFSPIFLIVAILIKIEDPKGPVIYKNKRIGQGGKIFNLYKFRYMKWEFCTKDAYKNVSSDDKAFEYEEQLIKKNSTRKGPLYKIKDDPRKTKIGNFIEKYSIDELPQFFNLIIGNMSLVGPRPHQPREVEKYSIDQKRLFTIKPGITGMAQVNGRELNDFEKEAEFDIFYIENWSMTLDFKIIFKTFGVVLKRAFGKKKN